MSHLHSTQLAVAPGATAGIRPLSRMNHRMILLRVEDGAWEGWKCMALDEFLERISLDAWKVEQMLVGMILPPDSHGVN